MTQLGIVYLIGAGASQAIDQARIPGMDVFPAMRDFFGGEWDELRRRLSRAGFMDADVQDARKKNTVFLAWPGPTMVDGIEQPLQALAERTTSRIPGEAQAAQDAHNFIKVFLNRFLVHLDGDVVAKAGETPYDLLAQAVRTSGRGHRHVFVSFNYDLWLERSLQAQGLWNAANGYLENKVNPIDLKFVGPNKTLQRLPTTEPSPTMIYKPHGSLSFLVPPRDSYRIPVLHLDDDATLDGKWAKGRVAYLPAGHDDLVVSRPGETSQALVPLVVPPAQDKGITGDFLYGPAG